MRYYHFNVVLPCCSRTSFNSAIGSKSDRHATPNSTIGSKSDRHATPNSAIGSKSDRHATPKEVDSCNWNPLKGHLLSSSPSTKSCTTVCLTLHDPTGFDGSLNTTHFIFSVHRFKGNKIPCDLEFDLERDGETYICKYLF